MTVSVMYKQRTLVNATYGGCERNEENRADADWLQFSKRVLRFKGEF